MKERLKGMVIFQCSICVMHFCILKDELISGMSVGILYMFSDRIFCFNSAMRQVRLFTDKKKHLNKIELFFFSHKVANNVRGDVKPCRFKRTLSIYAHNLFLVADIIHL